MAGANSIFQQVGQDHYDVATAVQKILQDYKSLQDIIAILGMDELSEEDKLTVSLLVYSDKCGTADQ